MVNNNIKDHKKVLISLGSNDGDREKNLHTAIGYLKETEALTDINCSTIYETEPVGLSDQPWFLNIAVSGISSMPITNFMQLCKSIEYAMGRKIGVRWGQRNIDIDLLLYGTETIHSLQLTVPHPRMHERRFVLFPAAEIAGERIHPIFGVSVNELLQSCKHSSVVKDLVSLSTLDLKRNTLRN